MTLTATYDEERGVQITETERGGTWRGGGHYNLAQGVTSVRRKRWWTIVVTYDTPSGAQELVIKPKKKCYLAQISSDITAAMRDDAAKTGGIKNIKWTATGR